MFSFFGPPLFWVAHKVEQLIQADQTGLNEDALVANNSVWSKTLRDEVLLEKDDFDFDLEDDDFDDTTIDEHDDSTHTNMEAREITTTLSDTVTKETKVKEPESGVEEQDRGLEEGSSKPAIEESESPEGDDDQGELESSPVDEEDEGSEPTDNDESESSTDEEDEAEQAQSHIMARPRGMLIPTPSEQPESIVARPEIVAVPLELEQTPKVGNPRIVKIESPQDVEILKISSTATMEDEEEEEVLPESSVEGQDRDLEKEDSSKPAIQRSESPEAADQDELESHVEEEDDESEPTDDDEIESSSDQEEDEDGESEQAPSPIMARPKGMPIHAPKEQPESIIEEEESEQPDSEHAHEDVKEEMKGSGVGFEELPTVTVDEESESEVDEELESKYVEEEEESKKMEPEGTHLDQEILDPEVLAALKEAEVAKTTRIQEVLAKLIHASQEGRQDSIDPEALTALESAATKVVYICFEFADDCTDDNLHSGETTASLMSHALLVEAEEYYSKQQGNEASSIDYAAALQSVMAGNGDESEEGRQVMDPEALTAFKKAATKVLYLFLKNADYCEDDVLHSWELTASLMRHELLEEAEKFY